jgi:hypothetical protein
MYKALKNVFTIFAGHNSFGSKTSTLDVYMQITAHTIKPQKFPVVKRPGRGVDHPPPSSAEVKERVELHLYTPSGPS